MSDVFISYARADRDAVKALAAALEGYGYSVWWDRMLVGGSRFRSVILEQLNLARAVLVVWSKDSVKSHFVEDEAERARQVNKLIPVLSKNFDVASIPLGFGGYHAPLIDEFHRIIESLEALNVLGSMDSSPMGAGPELHDTEAPSSDAKDSSSEVEQRLIHECLDQARTAELAFMTKLERIREEIDKLQRSLPTISSSLLDLMRLRLKNEADESNMALKESREVVNSRFEALQAFRSAHNIPYELPHPREWTSFFVQSGSILFLGALVSLFLVPHVSGLINSFGEVLTLCLANLSVGLFAGAWLLRCARYVALKHRAWSVPLFVAVIAIAAFFNLLAGHVLADIHGDRAPTLMQVGRDLLDRKLDLSLSALGLSAVGISIFCLGVHAGFTMWGAYPGYRAPYNAWVAARTKLEVLALVVRSRLDVSLRKNLAELDGLHEGSREQETLLSKFADALERETSAIQNAYREIEKAFQATIERYRVALGEPASKPPSLFELQLTVRSAEVNDLRYYIRDVRARVSAAEGEITSGKEFLERVSLSLAAELRNSANNSR